MSIIDKTILSLLLPGIQVDLNLSDSQVGLLSGAPFGVFYMIGGLVNGTLADRYSRTRLIALMVLIWSISTFICGLATSLFLLLVLRSVLGFSEGGLNPTAAAIVADTFPEKQRAAATGFLFSALGSGIMISFLAGGPLIDWLQNVSLDSVLFFGPLEYWQASFMLVSIPGFILAAILFMTLKDWQPSVQSSRADKGVDDIRWAALITFLRSNSQIFVGVLVGMPLMVIGPYSFLPWLPLYLQRVHDWEVVTTGVAYGISAGPAMLLGGLLIGVVVKFMRRGGYVDASYRLCLLSAVWLVVFTVLGVLATSPVLALSLITIGFVAFMVPPAMMYVVIGEVAPPKMRARVGGLSLITAGLTLNALGPLAVGLLNDYVFQGPTAIRFSLLWVTGPALLIGLFVILPGLSKYREFAADQAARTSSGAEQNG